MDDNAAQNPVKAEGLWWADCGLVIQAENTVYRVSRDQLASHSPVFHDMLLLPPPQNTETFEGCPLVRLQDKAEDMTTFLKALFSYDYFPPHPLETTLSTIMRVLRISDKYGVDGLRARALAHLDAAHPTTIAKWRKEQKSSLWAEIENDRLALETFILIRKLSLTWMLPFAFYRLCQAQCGIIVDLLSIDSDKLSTADKKIILTGLRTLEGPETREVLEFLRTPILVDECTDVFGCLAKRLAKRKEAEGWGDLDSCVGGESTGEPGLLPLDIWVAADWKNFAVCDGCLAYMKKTQKDALEKCWDRLPKIFDLPGWEDLEEERRRVMQL
ncbi:BTB domain-containing protein [Mycena kentingensis (nom. inval.)]|nr:BTB domain-containing protein [Mycena kentingensis (nom. inval.)]